MEDFTIKINNLGIYELRGVGRKLGVKSPTTLKRKELIQKITAIQNGDIIPEKRSTKGRPAKNLASVDGFFNDKKLISSSVLDNYDCENFDFQDLSVATSIVKFDDDIKNLDNKKTFIKSGFVSFVSPEKAEVITRENEIIILNSDMVNKYMLQSGMSVNVCCVKNDDLFIATDIKEDSVNSAKGFLYLKNAPLKEYFKLNSNSHGLYVLNKMYPMKMGQCVAVKISEEVDKAIVISKFTNAFKDYNTSTIGVFTKNNEFANGINNLEHSFMYDSLLKPQDKVKFFELAINIAKHRAENGLKTIVILDNLKEIFRTYYQLCLAKHNIESIAKENAIQLINYLLSFAKQTEKGCITIILLVDNECEYLNEFTGFINYSIKITRSVKNYDYVDLKESYSKIEINDAKVKEYLLYLDNDKNKLDEIR